MRQGVIAREQFLSNIEALQKRASPFEEPVIGKTGSDMDGTTCNPKPTGYRAYLHPPWEEYRWWWDAGGPDGDVLRQILETTGASLEIAAPGEIFNEDMSIYHEETNVPKDHEN